MVSATSGSSRYEQLQRIAGEFIARHDGAVHEDLLIRHVFGSHSRPDLWRPLLAQILSASDDLQLRGDGYWVSKARATLSHDEDDLTKGTLVAIDVETTGLKSRNHRIIEVGAVRYQDGVKIETLSTLIHPERAVPKYITKLTGIGDAHLIDAPPFAEIAPNVAEFIGDSPIIGYNVGFDISFLNAELERANLPVLTNEAVDVLPAAAQILPGTRARGLTSLARELGLDPRGSHRALADAETTGAVFFRLVPHFRDAGISSLRDLSGCQNRSFGGTFDRSDHARGRSLLDPDIVETAPETPGVYIMRASDRRVVYVGKAKNLRARIRSYYSQPLGYTRKMDGLLQSIDEIEFVETGSEVAALLLEAQLIARYRPQFNRQLRTADNYPYIRVETNNPWPRVTLARRAVDDGSTYFGPYRNARSARETVDAVNDIFPLRTCNRGFKDARSMGSPCTERDLGRCLAPCSGEADRDQYLGYVEEILSFLRGTPGPVLDRLQARLEDAAERLDFERAARIRTRIERVTALSESQRLLSDIAGQGCILVVLSSSADAGVRELMLVIHGRPWSRRLLTTSDEPEEVVGDLRRSWDRAIRLASPVILQRELDSVQILSRWLRLHWGHPSIMPLGLSEPDWDVLVQRASEVELID